MISIASIQSMISRAQAADGGMDAMDRLEEIMLDTVEHPVVYPVTHRFAPGVYLREMEGKAGTFAVGHRHRHEHLSIILSGRMRVMYDGQVREVTAPMIFTSAPGVRKAAFFIEDTRWLTIHPTEERDLAKLEDMIIIKSNGYLSRKLK